MKSVAKPGLAAAQSSIKKLQKGTAAATAKKPPEKMVDKPAAVAAKPVTKPIRIAKIDPLAPLPAKHSGHSKDSTAAR